MEKEAYLAHPLRGGVVQCGVCEHHCAISPGDWGRCGVRRNDAGTLYLTIHGEAIALNLDPIEKKPLFHFLPGESALSIGTLGCNFRCPFCQNWRISQARGEEAQGMRSRASTATPQTLLDVCAQYGARVIAYTYNEPTVFFEYTYDTARLAHKQGLHNVYVSNGFMTEDVLEMIEPYLDGINVDLKSFDEEFYRQQCQARLEPVKRNIRTIAQEMDIWIEVTTLLVPDLNDSEEELRALTEWLVQIDHETPWHVSAFRPDYQMRDRSPTSMAALSRAYDIGKEAGLDYVYVGNVMDVDRSSTYCPECGELLIRRHWYTVTEHWPERGICPACGHVVPGVWS